MHSMGAAKCMRYGGNEQGAQVDSEDNSEVRQGSARTSDHDACRLRIEDLLHFRIGREEAFQDFEHLVQLCRVGPKKAEQMPEKEQTRGEGEKELISHLGCQAHCSVHGGLIN